MTTSQFSVLFATLSVGCWAGTIATVATLIAARLRPEGGAAAVLESVLRVALWLAWIVAAVTTFGSLYYSLVAHFEPCELCWYQRICMYPLTAVLLVAAIRHDRRVWWYVVPQAAIGAVIATYHTQLQAFPKQATFCSAFNPCTTRYVWEFGFVSLPFMALAAFVFIITMTLLARTGTHAPAAAPPPADTPDERACNRTEVTSR